MNNCRRREDCRLCGSQSLERVCVLAPTPPANAFISPAVKEKAQDLYPLELNLCADCGHVQLGHVVDPSLLFSNYVYVSGTSPSFVAHFETYAKALWSISGAKPGDLAVDIGSNDGTLLRAFRSLGAEIQGVDPAQKIAMEANAAGIPTIIDFFSQATAETITAERGKAKIVTANNVCAHIDNLGGVISGVRDVLETDGIFVFEVSYLLDVLEHTLFDTIYHEHLDYHAVRPLRDFFKSQGFVLFHVERIASHGGSIRVFAALFEAGRSVSEDVTNLIQLEKKAGLFDSAAYSKLTAQIAEAGDRLTAEISAAKHAGRRIAGYGAPAKATTLMHQFGLTNTDIEYIVDDSPWKQGLLSPGLNVPIFASSQLEQQPVDDVVVLAWNFADPIIENNKLFLTGNRRFIVPLPNLRMVSADDF